MIFARKQSEMVVSCQENLKLKSKSSQEEEFSGYAQGIFWKLFIQAVE